MPTIDFRCTPRDARDFLPVVAVAALMTGTSAIAAGITSPDGALPPAVATGVVPPPAQANRVARASSGASCACRRVNHATRLGVQSELVSRVVEHRVPEDSHPFNAQVAEPGSFVEWARAAEDPRHILSRMAMLSRAAPRSYATEPVE